MIKAIILFLFFAALSLFITAEFIVGLALPFPPGVVFRLGSALLLCGFALLFTTGLLRATKIIIRSVRQYFSISQRMRRRLLFVQGNEERIGRMLHFRKLHIAYFHEQHKKRLLKANDHKHICSLSKAVHKDLLALKTSLPAPVFRELQREHTCFHRNRDSASLLKLQKKLAERV